MNMNKAKCNGPIEVHVDSSLFDKEIDFMFFTISAEIPTDRFFSFPAISNKSVAFPDSSETLHNYHKFGVPDGVLFVQW